MFIVLEGCDGSGLTTQTKLLSEALKRAKMKVWATKEPTKSEIGILIRKILAKQEKNEKMEDAMYDAKALALLFAADRMMHQKEIRKRLSEGYIVISDRYLLSSYVYQVEEGLSFEWVKCINEGCIAPDITFVLNVPPEVCMERLKGRKNFEIFENEAKLRKIHKRYLKLASLMENVFVIDGDRPKEEVLADILECLKRKYAFGVKEERSGK